MLSRFFSKPRPGDDVPQELYGSVVVQAREPVFFTDYGFEDTVTGRFDVLCLHLFLFSRRLVREDTARAATLNQEVFDIFVDSTDQALRELGVGDTSVPKRKKRLVHSFYATVEAFGAPLEGPDRASLREAVAARFAQDKTAGGWRHDALVDYILSVATELDDQPIDGILQGRLEWPDAASYVKA